MNYYIITGTSRGLGEAIATQLTSNNNTLFCISRKRNESLIANALKKNCYAYYFEYDLDCLDGIDELIEKIFKTINRSEAESICLINNAGTLKPIKPIGKCLSSDIISNMRINAIAPMILTSGFIRQTDEFDCKKIIINISSGAGIKPYFGWGSYCSSKAAIDMYTKCVGVEQVNSKNPVKIISFSPGIIDTEMQGQIRKSKNEDFEQVERFKKYKEDGDLKEPSFVAQKVLELIDSIDLKTGMLIDIKDI